MENEIKLDDLEKLVDELIKDEPQIDFVKQKMQEIGMPYSEDPIERLNTVLKKLHFIESTQLTEDKNEK